MRRNSVSNLKRTKYCTVSNPVVMGRCIRYTRGSLRWIKLNDIPKIIGRYWDSLYQDKTAEQLHAVRQLLIKATGIHDYDKWYRKASWIDHMNPKPKSLIFREGSQGFQIP